MSAWRSLWIGIGLTFGYLAVLAIPAWLAWNALRPEPWNQRTLKVRFESVRYEAAGLVFRYTVENRTGRSLRFLPGRTTIRALHRPDSPEAGYPSLSLPLDLDPHSTSRVELRLEIPSPLRGFQNAGQEWVGDLPEDTDRETPVSKIPRRKEQPAAGPPALIPQTVTPPDPLDGLEGFELADRDAGIRIVFPRMW